MVIRAHMRGVAEVDLSLFPLRQSFDPREFALEPLLHQRLVPLQCTMQRLLAGDAELGQKPPDRDQAQRDIEFIFDQRRHHLARPQRKCELELQRILLRHRVVNPLQLLAIEFRRTPKQRLGLQRSPAATPILCQPAIDRRTIDAQNISNNFRAFTILNTAYRTLTHRLQRGVVQSSRIVDPHGTRESYSRRHVKKSPLTYVLINIVRVKGFQIFADRHGRMRCYHRRTKTPVDLTKAPLGSAEFFGECARLAEAGKLQLPPKPGTLGMLIAEYKKHPAFTDLANHTKSDYQRIFDYLRPIIGTALARFDAPLVVRIRDKAAEGDKRRFGNYVKAVLSVLFGWALERGYMTLNPVKGVKNIRKRKGTPDPNRPWTDSERHAVLD